MPARQGRHLQAHSRILPAPTGRPISSCTRRVDSASYVALYCLIPRELEHLESALVAAYRRDGRVAVIVDTRTRERRKASRRRGNAASEAQRNGDERRRIHNADGHRIADRRADLVAAEPLAHDVPRAARRYAEQVRFVRRAEPDARRSRNVESARLVVRFQAGDCQAFNELYELHFDNLYAYLRVILRDAHEAEDAAQRAFLRAFEALRRFEVRSDGSFTGWLMRVARNEALNHRRKQARVTVEDLTRLVHRRDAEAANEVSPFGDGHLAAFVGRLPESQRQAIALRYGIGLDTDEIAAALERSPVAVRKLEHRALRFLEKRLIATGNAPTRFQRAPMLVRLRRAPVLGARRWALAGSVAGSRAFAGRRTYGPW